MNRVSLVCTVHDEVGHANVSELHAILERIGPEVIFLEVPPAAFDDHFTACTRMNLESLAVRQYRESHQVALVPVDLPTPEREFFEDEEQMRMRVGAESAEYRQLKRLDADYVRAYGFAYLNSAHCSKLTFDIDAEMRSTIEKMGDSRFIDIYKTWSETLELRELEMLKNIQEYCAGNSFNKGVFLVGAAHRQPIIDKIRGQSDFGSTRIQWDFSGWANQLT